MKLIKYLFVTILIVLLGCQKDPVLTTAGFYFQGVFITNEGNFQSGNASVTYYDVTDQTVLEKRFEATNNQPLGDVLQSMTLIPSEDKGYLVVNNSQKVEIIKLSDFQSIGTIDGLTSPRHFLLINDTTAYVSDLYAGAISVINLTNNQIKTTISTGSATEEMVKIGDEVFVTQPSLFENYSQQLFVINTVINEITDTIEVGYNPSNIKVDQNDNLWVVCNGDRNVDNHLGGIFRINPSSKKVDLTLPFKDNKTSFYPRLAMNAAKDRLYFLKLDIFTLSIDDTSLPTEPLIEAAGRDIYGLGVNPLGGNIYIGESGNFVQKGTVTIYDPTGQELHNFKAGVGVNGFYFL